MKLLGYFKGEFLDEKKNQKVVFAKIYGSEPLKTGGAGVRCFELKTRPEVVDKLTPASIGRECEAYYDRYERVVMIQFTEDENKKGSRF